MRLLLTANTDLCLRTDTLFGVLSSLLHPSSTPAQYPHDCSVYKR
jgi:hypothetical protein